MNPRKILPTMVSHSELRNLFYSADAVCFDVDSTVIREEGIDELAKICGVEDAVSEMELVSRLQERNVQVFLISGGFRSIVEHVASKLNIPGTNVFANRLKFYFNGEYAGFDETQPTAESGGKGKVIKLLKEKFHFKKIIMIGDGATDMEACPPAGKSFRDTCLHPFCAAITGTVAHAWNPSTLGGQSEKIT
ncbi:phosphoserine phosphatase-like isoform X5 [Macaca nemestrina]|uniref:phosphoserine phosphatase-like isoform X5 n=1 Tax=Macaca nemestrina TaxID=9545 RepID=UPI0039B83F0D